MNAKVDGKLVRVAAGKCEACDRTLQDSEMRIKGWNSGVELGLCRKCANFVNNPRLIMQAEEQEEARHIFPTGPTKDFDDHNFRGFRDGGFDNLFDQV